MALLLQVCGVESTSFLRMLSSLHRILRIFPKAVFVMAAPAVLQGQVAGSLDPGFRLTEMSSPNDTEVLYSTVVQPDGRILIGGSFTSLNGVARTGIVRLLPDGTPDTTFNVASAVQGIHAIAVQMDGKILIAGYIPGPIGQPYRNIARLHPDGSMDSTFNTVTGGDSQVVWSIAIQPDERILIGGGFTSVNGETRAGIARLLQDGSVDAGFNPGTGVTQNNGPLSDVNCVAIQPDGKILFGGTFTRVNGQPRKNIARLYPDGNVENTSTFDTGSGVRDKWDDNEDLSSVRCMAVQPDGKVLLAGSFDNVNGNDRDGIARLLANGTVESTATFDPGSGPGGYYGWVEAMALQTDGKILCGGPFTKMDGHDRNRIARLNADGTVESRSTFDSGSGVNGDYTSVWGAAVQADGRILLAGSFNKVDGQPRKRLARLTNDPAPQSVSIPGRDRVHWERAGASPEVGSVNFELSGDGGVNWSPLGYGVRIAGGWELTGLSLPATGQVRARARTFGSSDSSGLVESIAAFAFPESAGEAWRRTWFGSPENAGPGADLSDPDTDGIVNLVEFATGGHPLAPTPAIGQLVKNGSVLEFTCMRSKAALQELAWEPEWSESLTGPWSRQGLTAPAVLNDDGVLQQVQFSMPAGTAGRRFVRLRISRM